MGKDSLYNNLVLFSVYILQSIQRAHANNDLCSQFKRVCPISTTASLQQMDTRSKADCMIMCMTTSQCVTYGFEITGKCHLFSFTGDDNCTSAEFYKPNVYYASKVS